VSCSRSCHACPLSYVGSFMTCPKEAYEITLLSICVSSSPPPQFFKSCEVTLLPVCLCTPPNFFLFYAVCVVSMERYGAIFKHDPPLTTWVICIGTLFEKMCCLLFYSSLRCQSLLYLKLFKMRKHEVKEYQKVLADYHQKVSI
jgi:hypothetical protein